MIERILSVGSITIAFLVSAVSAYLFNQNIIKFEALIWIVVGCMALMVIMIYQEMNSRFDIQKEEAKRIDEKLKIYKRLAKIEERLKI